MRCTRLYTAILLSGVMLLNICKYQLPYIEYNLFKDYIAENLCIKANNDCRGKCFFNKQIDMINETDNTANNTTEKQQITLGVRQNSLFPDLCKSVDHILFLSTDVHRFDSSV
jgi:hypothetical protein